MELLFITLVAGLAVSWHMAHRPRCPWCNRPLAMHDRLEGFLLCHYPREWRR